MENEVSAADAPKKAGFSFGKFKPSMKLPAKWIRLVLIGLGALVILGALVYGAMFCWQKFFNHYQIISDKNGALIVFMSKKDATNANINKVMDCAKADEKKLLKKHTNVFVTVQIYDDESVASAVKDRANKPIAPVKTKEEMDAQIKALQEQQKTESPHIIATFNNKNSWKISYGTNYISLKGK